MPTTASLLVDLEGVGRGQAHFARITRQLLAYVHPALAERLPADDPGPYLEPLLFTHLTSEAPVMPLDQVLFGYLPEDARPRSTGVVADRLGVVHLPAVGYARTDGPGATLTLEWAGSLEGSVFRRGAEIVGHRSQGPSRISAGRGSFEVTDGIDPLTEVLFRDDDGSPAPVGGFAVDGAPGRALAVAVQSIARLVPWLSEAMATCVRRVTLFSGPRPNSFAAPRAHGAVFLNTEADADEVFFVEDLAHQCGHVIFNCLTFERDRLFVVHPDTPVARFNGDPADGRSVYVTIHGLFTEALMTEALTALSLEGALRPGQEHELLGRLAYVLRRFRFELANLGHPGILSDEGRERVDSYRSVFEEALDRFGDLVGGVDLSNQPYAFSYRQFVAANPIGLRR